MQPGVPCTATFTVDIPNDPALCNTAFRDRAAFFLDYPAFDPPLSADAGATATLAVVCLASIEVTKTADALGKVTDPVSYTIQVCNTSLITLTKTSVIDSIIPGVDAAFGATMAPGACESENFTRTVVAGDPDPLVNTVTAIYTAGLQTATDQASATTNLFQPSVDVAKSCGPDPIQVGQAELCAITVTNTSSADTPILEGAVISDTLTGNLLDPANLAVVNSTCGPTLAVGASCVINTTRTVLAGDVSPLVNTVTVTYNPDGFPNTITDTASDQVVIVAPSIEVTKTADALGKVTDPVSYTIQVCNTSLITLTKTSVIDSIIPGVDAAFGATLAPGACESENFTRTVVAGDPDPLVNTVTAIYTAGLQTATDQASATTNLFEPSVDVAKSCGPDPIQVGQAELCAITVTNTSSADTPILERRRHQRHADRQPARPGQPRRRQLDVRSDAGRRRLLRDQHDPHSAGW